MLPHCRAEPEPGAVCSGTLPPFVKRPRASVSLSLFTPPPPALIVMLFTVFLRLIPALAFIGRIHAAAIDPYPPHNHSISSILDHSSHSPACNDIKHCRTLWSVIYGCLATIFACTWVSFHPDVPSRYDTQCRILAIRVFSVVISFLVPELTVAKAVSQWWQLWEHEPAVKGTY